MMEVPMDDIKDIQKTVSELKTQVAVTDSVLKSVLKTQEDIVQILKKQAAQEEKNKVYDATVKKCDSMNVRIASISAFIGIIAGAAGKYIFS